MSGFEVFTETVSESVCEYNLGSLQKGDGREVTPGKAELLNIARDLALLEPGQALVIVKKGDR